MDFYDSSSRMEYCTEVLYCTVLYYSIDRSIPARENDITTSTCTALFLHHAMPLSWTDGPGRRIVVVVSVNNVITPFSLSLSLSHIILYYIIMQVGGGEFNKI